MVSHVFPLAASFSNTVDTMEGNGVEKEGSLSVFNTDILNTVLLTAEIIARLTGKIGTNSPIMEGLGHLTLAKYNRNRVIQLKNYTRHT